jgi:undecaprenyl-diphosphatase
MVLAYAALLGVIQGLTEFLPISSTAHLVLAEQLFTLDPVLFGQTFDVACHLGTLAAVVVYFWPDLAAMARSLPRVGTLFGPRPDPAGWTAALIVLGTVPAVVVGLAFGRAIEEGLRTPPAVAVALTGVALIFFAVERWGSPRRTGASLGLADAALIGCAQACALVPGVSRSGATIAAGMALGLRRADAARFGFLLGIPAILAAAAKQGLPLVEHGLPPGEAEIFVVGIVTSGIVGYFAVSLLLRFLTRHSLRVFAWYRLVLASAVVFWSFHR